MDDKLPITLTLEGIDRTTLREAHQEYNKITKTTYETFILKCVCGKRRLLSLDEFRTLNVKNAGMEYIVKKGILKLNTSEDDYWDIVDYPVRPNEICVVTQDNEKKFVLLGGMHRLLATFISDYKITILFID